MDFKSAANWAEKNPIPTFGIVIVGGLAILYFTGFFSSSSVPAGANTSQYDAEVAANNANQTALQIATLNANASTNQALIQGATLEEVNQANNNASVAINSDNVTSATTINQSNNNAQVQTNLQNNQTAVTLGTNNNLLAILENNNQTFSPAGSTNAFGLQ